MILRLDKYLADMDAGTRSEVKRAASKGQVLVNGTAAKKADLKVDTERDRVVFQGREISYSRFEYYMLNKPAGVVSATEDSRDRTVLELLGDGRRRDLFPVGRLDKDTEGLLLITNDGDLAHRLLSPKKHVDKTYYAKTDGCVTDEDVRIFAEGMDIGEERPTLPGRLEILEAGECSRILLTIQEGKFHQVKRMFEAVGKKVIYLKRLAMGPLVLDESLAPGECRKLTEDEKEQLLQIVKRDTEKTE